MKKRKSRKVLVPFYQSELDVLKIAARRNPYSSRNELIRRAVRYWGEHAFKLKV